MPASDVVCGAEAHLLPQQGPVNISPFNAYLGRHTPNLNVLGRLVAMIAQNVSSVYDRKTYLIIRHAGGTRCYPFNPVVFSLALQEGLTLHLNE